MHNHTCVHTLVLTKALMRANAVPRRAEPKNMMQNWPAELPSICAAVALEAADPSEGSCWRIVLEEKWRRNTYIQREKVRVREKEYKGKSLKTIHVHVHMHMYNHHTVGANKNLPFRSFSTTIIHTCSLIQSIRSWIGIPFLSLSAILNSVKSLTILTN